jgi:flagellar hook-length control protein FliK
LGISIMNTDLFFSQPVPGKQTFGISADKTKPNDPVYSTRKNSTREPIAAKAESFLKTLEKVSRKPGQIVQDAKRHRNKQAAAGSISKEDKSEDTTFDPSIAQNEDKATREPEPEDSQSDGAAQSALISQIMELVEAMESMGLHALDGGSDTTAFIEGNPADAEDFASLRMLMSRIQQSLPVMSDALKAAFEKLQLLMTEALKGQTSIMADGNTDSGGTGGRVAEAERILKWLQELAAEPLPQKDAVGMGEGQASGAGQPSAQASSGVGSLIGPTENFVDQTVNSQAGGPNQTAERLDADSQAASRGAEDPENDSPENPASINGKPEKTASGPAESKAATDPGSDNKSAGQAGSPQPSKSDQSSELQDKAQANQDHKPAKHFGAAGTSLESGNPSAGFNQASAGDEPVSKLLHEAQALKEGEAKISRGMNEETGGKVIKAETVANDTVLPNFQSYPTDKAADTAALSRESDSDRNGLKAQTLDQIVQKAAIHLKDGQNEARIDLKPEYLGHIRMQIISENHHVTVKIMAEHGFVKDMIENNAHQLKADLQQQGLNIDKLEVTVSRDSDGSGHPRERLAGMRNRQDAPDTGRNGHTGQDLPQDRRQWRRPIGGAGSVDYFA